MRLLSGERPFMMQEAHLMRRLLRVARLLLICLALTLPARGLADGGSGPALCATSSSPPNAKGTNAAGIRVIVRLETPSLVSAAQSGQGTAKGGQPQDASRAQARIEKAQRDLRAAIRRSLPGAEVERSYRAVFDGLAVRLPADRPELLASLRALDGVVAVYEETAFRPSLYGSPVEIGAPALWEELGGSDHAGEGVAIALLDSGIEVSHPMFDPAGFSYPQGYPKGDARFTTPKIVVARAYFRPTDPPVAGEDSPVPGPSGSSHGTHLAGVAAGNPVMATYRQLTRQIAGIAPRAALMNYRVFYPSARTGEQVAYTAEILQAIDDAVADGADVLCCGWTALSPTPPYASPVAAALEAAVEAGCVVVAGAGNEGPGYGSTSYLPGGIPRVLTVGAVSKAQTISHNRVDLLGPSPVPTALQNQPYAEALFGGTLTQLLGPAPYADVREADAEGSPYACQPLVFGGLEGKAALASRGECTFANKAYYAEQAGAVLTLIYNNSDEDITPMACAGDYCDPGEITIPAIMVAQDYGQALLDWLEVHAEATLQVDPTGRMADSARGVVRTFSGRGPSFAQTLKPDVVAPGHNVLSAYVDEQSSDVYGQLSGSSIACAHAAGAAALLLQAHPEWTHDEIKAALMATATLGDLHLDEEKVSEAGVLDRGAGLIDVAAASSTPLLFAPAGLSLPHARAGKAYALSATARDLRSEGGRQVWSIALETTGGVIINLPSEIALSPGMTTTLDLEVGIPPNAIPGEAEAVIHLTSGDCSVHLSLWVHIEPTATSGQVLIIDNDFSLFDAHDDYAAYVAEALDELGLTYQTWRADSYYDHPQTLPDLGYLQAYEAVVWITGDNAHPDGYYVVSTPLTRMDLQVLAAYLDGGGRLVAIGQNLAQASDVNLGADPAWERACFYHQYLGAHWIQASLYDPQGLNRYPPPARSSIIGLPQTFLAGLGLDIGAVGDGASNQTSVDEIAPGGFADGSDAHLVHALMVASEAYPQESGYVALCKVDEPSLEDDTVEIPYRTVYYAFGYEGINDNPGATPRHLLLQRTLDWLWDEVTVDIQPVTGAPHSAIPIHCTVQSSVGVGISSYRWQVSASTGTARVLSSEEPQITLTYAAPGEYQVAVEATDDYGHRAVDRTTVTVVVGGGSMLTVEPDSAGSGEVLTYRLLLKNSSAQALPITCTLELPEQLAYVSHTGATFAEGVWRWADTLAPEATYEATLRARVREGTPRGTEIVATALFETAGSTFSRSTSAWVSTSLYIPLTTRYWITR